MMRRLAVASIASVSALSFMATAAITAQAADSTADGNADGSGTSVLNPIDPQHWVDQSDMTWADYTPTPIDYSTVTAERNFHGAIVMLDFPDESFRITQSTPDAFGNPILPDGSKPISRDEVPEYYRSLLNDPTNTLNKGETIDEYWKEQTGGKIGVNLEAYGTLQLPGKSYEYGLEWWMNGQDPDKDANGNDIPFTAMSDFCPADATSDCNRDVRSDAMELLKNSPQYKAKYGDTDPAKAFDEIFFVLAGEDESSTWQEFGEMKYQNKEDVPDSLGATDAQGNRLYNKKGQPIPNWAPTRYVGWTSWKAAARFWPNASYATFNPDGSVATAGTVVLTEASGSGTYAHEFSHVLNVADNYRNPFGTDASDGGPLRDTAGTYDILSRGSFNGPGGPHQRWDIPSFQGDVMAAGMALRNRVKIGALDPSSYIDVSRSDLTAKGALVADVQAREVQEKNVDLGINLRLDGGDRQSCDMSDKATGWACDGGGYDSYTMEVIDRMGTDSSQPDHGVMIAKAKQADNSPFLWTIDANPQDIGMVDYVDPSGKKVMVTRGDQRQLNDALFHAGIDSGSQYEYEDADNGLHFYIANQSRDARGVLHYTVAVRSTAGAGSQSRGVSVATDGAPSVVEGGAGAAGAAGTVYGQTVAITNTGDGSDDSRFDSDIYRVKVDVESADGSWKAQTPSAIVTAKAGETVKVPVYAYRDGAGAGADGAAGAAPKVTVTVSSETAALADDGSSSVTKSVSYVANAVPEPEPEPEPETPGTPEPQPGEQGSDTPAPTGPTDSASGDSADSDAEARAADAVKPAALAATGAALPLGVACLVMAGGALAVLAIKRLRSR